DEAGQTAADRVYAWEQAHDVEMVVVELPAGSDPDELAQTSPQTLHDAVGSARAFLKFRLDRVLAAADLRSAESRARAADAALAVVAEHPNDLVRDQYVMQVADACRIEPAQLRDRLEAIRRAPRKPSEAEAKQRRSNRRGRDDVPSYE